LHIAAEDDWVLVSGDLRTMSVHFRNFSTLDPEVLHIAAEDDWVLVSGDLRTMSVHFRNFIVRRESPGVLLIPSSRSIGAAIDGLLVAWLSWAREDFRNQIRWLP
jgi:hypothetical protein